MDLGHRKHQSGFNVLRIPYVAISTTPQAIYVPWMDIYDNMVTHNIIVMVHEKIINRKYFVEKMVAI